MDRTGRETINAQIRAEFGDIVTRENLKAFAAQHGNIFPYWIANDNANRAGRGQYKVPAPTVAGTPLPSYPMHTSTLTETAAPAVPVAAPAVSPLVAMLPTASPVWTAAEKQAKAIQAVNVTLHNQQAQQTEKFDRLVRAAAQLATIPPIDKAYVPFGDYEQMKTIVTKRVFFPLFITGLSGNGKTLGVEQVCAQLQREYIRAGITTETDEDDLLGGFRLVTDENGATVTAFEPGPVIIAMIRGAVLLLDEVDLGSPKLLCIQAVLEGKPILLKKLGIVIYPSPGFQVFATANTKGRGSDDGKFNGTGLLNESFLERFAVTIEQEYPDEKVERVILRKTYEALGGKMDATTTAFFNTLAKWAGKVRETYFEGGITDVVSTRRLVHIVKAFWIFTDSVGPLEAQGKALEGCINRFDTTVKDALVDFYNKLAPDSSAPDSAGRYEGATVEDPGI